jgi:hypothetical protein
VRHLSGIIVDWNHRQQIHEWLTSLSIVDKAYLRFGHGADAVLQVEDGVIIAIFSLDARFHLSIW